MRANKSVFIFKTSLAIALSTVAFCAASQNANVVSSSKIVAGGMPQCTPPKIEFEMLVQPAEVRNAASVKTMTQYSQSSHPTVGLYRSRQRVYIRGQRIGSSATNEVCISSLFITYAINHAIDIGSEYKPGTCAYDETVRHERMHEQIHLQKAKEAQEHIYRELVRDPLYFSGTGYQQEADAWLSKAVEWATKVYTGYILPAQEAFDSPDEYKRFAKACEHELRYHGYTGAGTR